MNKKIIGFLLCILMCLTAIEIYPQLNVEAKPDDPTGNVGLDYDNIYDITEQLSNIVFTSEGIYHNIKMGRYFGTKGDRYAGNLTKIWMEKFAKYYIDNNKMKDLPTKESIILNNAMQVTEFGLTLHKGNCQAIISNEESYLAPRMSIDNDVTYEGDDVRVEIFTPEERSLKEYENEFNVSYRRFNSSYQSFIGSLTYISNYSNASENDTYMKIHLINCADNIFNDTVNMIADSNGTGFILMRDNITNITNWELPIPGVAISNENGNLLYNLTQNDSIGIATVLPYEAPIPEKGNLTIYTCSNNPIDIGKIYLVDVDNQFNSDLLLEALINPLLRAIIVSDPTYEKTHWMIVPNGIEYSLAWKGPDSFTWCFYSSLFKPYYYVNSTVYDTNGAPHDIFEWANPSLGYLKADFYGTQQRENRDSYNVYCTVKGRDHSKRVIISGGHLDGYWGQMSTDDPIGVATMLGILKYMNDSCIIPKYDTTFIAFSGEEWICRGSRDWVNRHIPMNDPSAESVVMVFNLDVLAYKNCSVLDLQCCDTTDEAAHATRKIIENISNFTDYNGTVDVTYTSSKTDAEHNDGYAFYLYDIPFIEFGEDDYMPIRHKTGERHTMGDVMSEIDFEDLTQTADIVWNVTKYYCVNPNCSFHDVTYTAIDSPDDSDTLVDTIQATFTANSLVPNDRIMIKGVLIDNSTSEEIGIVFKNFTVISSEATGSIFSIMIPSTYDEGDFRFSLELYNSTGKINLIINPEGDYVDDTDNSAGSFHLYHPFGNIVCGISEERIDNRITGSVFTIHESGIADNITAYVLFPLASPPVNSKCMIYRLNDSTLIGTTEEISCMTQDGGEWKTYDFSEPKPVLVKDTQYILVCWCDNIDQGGSLFYDDFEDQRGCYDDSQTYGDPPGKAYFTNEYRLYSIYCSYSKPTTIYYFNQYDMRETWINNPGYMVDGNIATFSSTYIGRDVELCNRTNCSGTNLGDISKVEIRAYGYRTGSAVNIIFRPVFGGSSDGNNHSFTPPVGLLYATWSQWFDITNDRNAPTTWTWSDIEALDCDVEMGAMSSFPPPTVYCSKIQIRVTYSNLNQ